jgi:hypothetical protein
VSGHPRIVAAVLRKDLQSLWPMAALTVALLVLGIVFENYAPGGRAIGHVGDQPVGDYLDLATWITAALLVTAAIQLDTTVSATHDWLTRPISRVDLVLAKAVFIGLVVLVPVFASRIVIYVLDGRSFMEALLAATNVSSFALSLGLPLVVAAAAITPTLLQAGAAMICVFVVGGLLPTFATQLGYAFDESLVYTGSFWIVLGAIGTAMAVMTVAVLWLQYGRGGTGLARAVFALVVSLPLIGTVLVRVKDVLAVQQAVAPEPPPQDFSLTLNGGCFLAESIDESAGDPAVAGTSHSRFMGAGLWDESQLAGAGRKPVAYATTFSTDGVPKGWRLAVANAAATYKDERGSAV